jgi:predicted nucleic acid-binding protein
MTSRVLLDTGPLVAGINRRDRFHDWTRAQLGEITPPLLTCEPVLAESCFLLHAYSGGSAAVLELVDRGIIKIAFRVEDHVQAIAKLMAKYASVSMSLADACLVRMSELDPQTSIMTIDTGFRIYRRYGRQMIPLIEPRAGRR